MSKILKNNTIADISINDTGITIGASSSYTINTQDYILFAASSDVIAYIGSGDIIVNDGSFDLNISAGVDLIKGIFPTTINAHLTDNVHGKPIRFSALGSLKIATDNIIGDFRYDKYSVPELFDIETSGDGRYTIEEGDTGIKLVASIIGSSITLLSKERYYYQSARGLMIQESAIFGDITISGYRREWGMKYLNNGVFFRYLNSTLSIVILCNGVETEINSSSWDIPITPNQYGHLYFMQLEWFGVGPMYFYYDEVLVHTYRFTGTSINLSLGTPDLKKYYKLENISGASEAYIKHGCSSIVTEGNSNSVRVDHSPRDSDLAQLNKTILSAFTGEGGYQNLIASDKKELMVLSRIDSVQMNKIITLLESSNANLKLLTEQLYLITGLKGEIR